MSDIAIQVEGLSKLYHIGKRVKYKTARESLTNALGAPFRWMKNIGQPRQDDPATDLWALKDVSFEVKRGEVVGIIGRNGAGKSTLLKVLSRITEPTSGRIKIHGRVGSLLEVGTGFHPELTGRENIFLNGAILGMHRPEIANKFDEIVAFSEVEKFIDTPVKHYSSGMYTRLAFAVAAHLEPEILIVDEVLAVGDAQFQKKCMGKMKDVGASGRTVLFVSHNIPAIRMLCTSSYLLHAGQVAAMGPTNTVLNQYLGQTPGAAMQLIWEDAKVPGNEEIRLRAIRLMTDDREATQPFSSATEIVVEMECEVAWARAGLCIGFDIGTPDGQVILRSFHTDPPENQWPVIASGINRLKTRLPANLLSGGRYLLYPRIGIDNKYWIINDDTSLQFDVLLEHGESPLWNTLNRQARPGLIAPVLSWSNQMASADLKHG